jgi:hypothetical protein
MISQKDNVLMNISGKVKLNLINSVINKVDSTKFWGNSGFVIHLIIENRIGRGLIMGNLR